MKNIKNLLFSFVLAYTFFNFIGACQTNDNDDYGWYIDLEDLDPNKQKRIQPFNSKNVEPNKQKKNVLPDTSSNKENASDTNHENSINIVKRVTEYRIKQAALKTDQENKKIKKINELLAYLGFDYSDKKIKFFIEFI